jgi:serine/threonine-protein kinase
MPIDRQEWAAPKPLAGLRTAELVRPGTVFQHGGFAYRATGEAVGHGGMGDAFVLERRRLNDGSRTIVDAAPEQVVGKVFHHEFLYQLRTDEVTRRDRAIVERHAAALAKLEHPNILPLYASTPIADNHLTITPRMAATLRQAITANGLGPRTRVELFVQALRGLERLHAAGFVHRDVTLRNILVDAECRRARLFDFDLTLALAEVVGESYLAHYQGRIFGSPGYSIAPEVVDEILMAQPIGLRLDLYAIGGAIFALFTDELPYGPSEDMWSLMVRIAEGMVFQGNSRIHYPPEVPAVLRPIIEGCLERDPAQRTADVGRVIAALERALPELDATPTPVTLRIPPPEPTAEEQRLAAIHAAARDPEISLETVSKVERALAYHGYQIERALGRVKSFPIFLVAPRPDVLAAGAFPDANTYPKIVTVLTLGDAPDREAQIDRWLGSYLPILRQARQGHLTTLHRVAWDSEHGLLLLLSEYVDDARFGRELEAHDLTLREAIGLGTLVTAQVARLHRRGMAHNNVCAASLLLRGSADSREVHPAMVGIVTPSLDPRDMAVDVRQLAGLVLSWLRPGRVDELAGAPRAGAEAMRTRLEDLSRATAPSIDALAEVLADGAAALDDNFAVLRAHGGDLRGYAMLWVGPALYGRLWDAR